MTHLLRVIPRRKLQPRRNPGILGDTGDRAMGQLRRALGVPREEQEGERLLISPQPGVWDLDHLRYGSAPLD